LTRRVLYRRAYFGEKIAFYFSFVQSYTRWLIWPSIFGVLAAYPCYLGDGVGTTLAQKSAVHAVVIAYSAYILLWAFTFTAFWARTESELAFVWGVGEWCARRGPARGPMPPQTRPDRRPLMAAGELGPDPL
jgi:hypothetical protein